MALVNIHLLQVMNEMAGSLSSGERRTLSYLCGSLDTEDSSLTGVKELLKSQLMRRQMDDLFLVELMFELRRFDILRKVFGTSKDEAERTLRDRGVLSRYRVLMADVSEEMTNEDLKNVIFLLSSTLPREKMDTAKNFLDVLVELEKLDKVSSERVVFLEQCLRSIGRIDLARKVNMYQRPGGAPQQPSLVPHQIIQQQRLRAPSSVPTPSYALQLPRHGQSQHIARHYDVLSSAPEHLPVAVGKSQNCQSPLDEYKLPTDPRGICVIIDCVGNDGEMLKRTFEGLHFKVILYKWLGVDDTLSALRGTFRQRENHEAGAFVCCIISRGTATNLLATDSRHTGLHLGALRHLFSAKACPSLAGKPKLFFIQRYGVPEPQACVRAAHRDEDLETDGADGPSRWEYVPTDADVFWSHCWTDECQLEQGHHRSVYLQALTDALHKGQGRKTHLVDIHTEVNGAIYDHNKRNPGEIYHIDLKHTLRKNLYLP